MRSQLKLNAVVALVGLPMIMVIIENRIRDAR